MLAYNSVILAEQRDESRRTAHTADTLKHALEEQVDMLDVKTEDTRDITTDLTRQYKLMQSQLMAKILDLQENSRVLKDQLGMRTCLK